jgi:hypothetical protein
MAISAVSATTLREAPAETWLAAHPEATRIRRSVGEIAASGLTLAKLTVAANSLGERLLSLASRLTPYAEAPLWLCAGQQGA